MEQSPDLPYREGTLLIQGQLQLVERRRRASDERCKNRRRGLVRLVVYHAIPITITYIFI